MRGGKNEGEGGEGRGIHSETDAKSAVADGDEERTTEVMVAFRTRRTEGIRIFDEALPLLRVFTLGIWYSKSVPHAGVDFRHLWLFDDLDFALSTPRLLGVCSRRERERGVVRTAACGGPYLKK